MRKIILITLVLFSFAANAQQTTIKNLEETNKKLEQTQNQLNKAIDSLQKAQINKQQKQSYGWISTFQKEQKAKQRKQAITRVAIGVGFLAILVIGISKRKRQKN